MNIYARYFDQDYLATGFDDLMDFLSSIPEIPVNQRLADDVRAYVESDMPYPKRYKIRPRVYFILIKTNAPTMEEFKAHNKEHAPVHSDVQGGMGMRPEMMMSKRDLKVARLAEVRDGWYLGTIVFKRVIQIAGTTKFRYQDTTFQAYVQADSGNGCYSRIVAHLKGRTEIDLRSQFPSARGDNFSFEYVGETLPTA